MGAIKQESTLREVDMLDDIDVNKSLNEIENLLRNNIAYILKNKYGIEWEKHLGVSDDRIKLWKDRQNEERRRLRGDSLDPRILYYSDFYDLETIITKNWEEFQPVFMEKKDFEYKISRLESFRNPNAHNRELMDHQKHLLIGIIGELKIDLMRYRGDKDKIETYFPSIDSIQINSEAFNKSIIILKNLYRVGDKIEIIIFASTPPNQKIQYQISGDVKSDWSESNKIVINIDKHCKIGTNVTQLRIKSNNSYHKQNDIDDLVIFHFTIVPAED